MTGLTEPSVSEEEASGSLGARWRAEAARAQQDALPSGRVVVSCSAPIGVGGLGRHLNEIIDALARGESESVPICGSSPGAPAGSASQGLLTRGLGALLALPPMRLAQARGARRFAVDFDAYAAQRLPPRGRSTARARSSPRTPICDASFASTPRPIASIRWRAHGQAVSSSGT
jgi:hypothetical protein